MHEEGWEIDKILEYFSKKWHGPIEVFLKTASDESWLEFSNGKVVDQENPNTYYYAKKLRWIIREAVVNFGGDGVTRLVIKLVTQKALPSEVKAFDSYGSIYKCQPPHVF